MALHRPPVLDMAPDGSFREPAPLPPMLQRVGRMALIVAVLAGVFAVAALALWFALILIPVALGAGLLAYISYRLGGRGTGGSAAVRFGAGVSRWGGGRPPES